MGLDLRDRYKEVIRSVVLVGLLAILSIFDIVTISSFSPGLAAAIFTVIIGTTATLFSILVLVGEIISRAESKEYLEDVRRTFAWPVKAGVIGFLLSIISDLYYLNLEFIGTNELLWFTFSEWNSLVISGILFFSILSFKNAFGFILLTVLGWKGKDSSDKDDCDEVVISKVVTEVEDANENED